jgi:C-terminal processing protease CtpA/Prc
MLAENTIRALKKKTEGIEGIYTNTDSTYTIAIVQRKNNYRDYAGVIVWSATDMWKPGQVKLELRSAGINKYTTIMYYRDHSARAHTFTYDGKCLGDEWIRDNQRKAYAASLPKSENTNAKQINDHTLYLRIPSFGADVAREVDSVMKASESLLRTLPNLVIDLRGNGGGSDFSYNPITPWLYTNPIIRVGSEVKSTKDNISAWRKMVLDDPNIPEEVKEETRPLVEEMERNIGRNVSSGEDDTTIMDKVEPNPKKVVVLIDGGCASSAEQFLLMAKQSKKVTIMGQHTAGILDYGNMRLSATSPCNDITLFYATTRSRRIDKGEGIDNKGIQPNVVLAKDKDWVAQAVRYMDQK